MSEKTHEFTIEGTGDFVARKSTARLGMEVARRSRDILGTSTDKDLAVRAVALATLEAMLVTAPDGFDVEHIDLFDDDEFELVLKVNGRLREAEDRFREERAAART